MLPSRQGNTNFHQRKTFFTGRFCAEIAAESPGRSVWPPTGPLQSSFGRRIRWGSPGENLRAGGAKLLILGAMSDPLLSTTAFGFEGYRISRHLGLVRGIIVRSRSIVGNIGAALQTIVGGNISIYTSLCERARQDAFAELCQHAA